METQEKENPKKRVSEAACAELESLTKKDKKDLRESKSFTLVFGENTTTRVLYDPERDGPDLQKFLNDEVARYMPKKLKGVNTDLYFPRPYRLADRNEKGKMVLFGPLESVDCDFVLREVTNIAVLPVRGSGKGQKIPPNCQCFPADMYRNVDFTVRSLKPRHAAAKRGLPKKKKKKKPKAEGVERSDVNTQEVGVEGREVQQSASSEVPTGGPPPQKKCGRGRPRKNPLPVPILLSAPPPHHAPTLPTTTPRQETEVERHETEGLSQASPTEASSSASAGPSPVSGTDGGLDGSRGFKPLSSKAVAVKVTHMSTGNSRIFNGVRRAADALGVNASTVSRALQHKVGLGGKTNKTVGFEITPLSAEQAGGSPRSSGGEGAAAASTSFLAAPPPRCEPKKTNPVEKTKQKKTKETEGSSHASSAQAALPQKRKRGRPRKYPLPGPLVFQPALLQPTQLPTTTVVRHETEEGGKQEDHQSQEVEMPFAQAPLADVSPAAREDPLPDPALESAPAYAACTIPTTATTSHGTQSEEDRQETEDSEMQVGVGRYEEEEMGREVTGEGDIQRDVGESSGGGEDSDAPLSGAGGKKVSKPQNAQPKAMAKKTPARSSTVSKSPAQAAGGGARRSFSRQTTRDMTIDENLSPEVPVDVFASPSPAPPSASAGGSAQAKGSAKSKAKAKAAVYSRILGCKLLKRGETTEDRVEEDLESVKGFESGTRNILGWLYDNPHTLVGTVEGLLMVIDQKISLGQFADGEETSRTILTFTDKEMKQKSAFEKVVDEQLMLEVLKLELCERRALCLLAQKNLEESEEILTYALKRAEVLVLEPTFEKTATRILKELFELDLRYRLRLLLFRSHILKCFVGWSIGKKPGNTSLEMSFARGGWALSKNFTRTIKPCLLSFERAGFFADTDFVNPGAKAFFRNMVVEIPKILRNKVKVKEEDGEEREEYPYEMIIRRTQECAEWLRGAISEMAGAQGAYWKIAIETIWSHLRDPVDFILAFMHWRECGAIVKGQHKVFTRQMYEEMEGTFFNVVNGKLQDVPFDDWPALVRNRLWPLPWQPQPETPF
uniref:Uncharacterized protein n=1 Tax=Chromera velia CCMP2878 TaxID=1169474 RepID=A0A0G4FK62_9ALVE|eukprot:Cvel_17451.t1-p1 / transcript=Cvel_17451.t1 / gene=Cvel_17451 / organism=Chromera_velia_CCMP2878 / gene_product=hypothetical protein / transcript_product=hypothetical protein / location=Cvel_scaffold1393:18258-25524(+) / protein_length=1067 / sequence_SO=supercontig / SO=protein_coding / is_pseudo=false